ncbi:uncharacterized protein LOC128548906 isoform X2 [Mercenaria mercenaria]|uniref:uncharacterized protein LOC128548906 isoform X2 n=1 Tax=Mercenaria mercenaria TaxID=6596 RepID=UPI00234E7497|nr:uncharacterized protein LOC128548906 isoform X2 [Mercenaria mercenaria]
MLLIDDNTLKSYLPAYGDRVSAIAFCRSQTEGDLSSTESNQCSNALNELRGKWKKERSTLRSCGFKAGNAYVERTIRRLELGWMDYSNESMCYKQVWQRCGGGVRHLTVEKTLSLKAVLNHALDAFFPSGVSQRSILQEFELKLKDFQGMCVNMEKTINELYIESKLKILWVYLYSKKKTEKVGEEVHTATNKPSSTVEEVAPEVQIVTTAPIAVRDATLLASNECMSSSDELDQHTVVSLPDL